MENLSLLPGDGVWNNVTTSSVDDDYHSTYLANIRYVAFKIIYIIIGTIGFVRRRRKQKLWRKSLDDNHARSGLKCRQSAYKSGTSTLLKQTTARCTQTDTIN